MQFQICMVTWTVLEWKRTANIFIKKKKNLFVFCEKITVYSLGVTAGWINNDNEINFGWIIPVKACINIMTAGMLPFFAAYLIHINVWRKRLILAGGELGKREKKKPNTIVYSENEINTLCQCSLVRQDVWDLSKWFLRISGKQQANKYIIN